MKLASALLAFLLVATLCPAQTLSPRWEELTAADFPKALAASKDVCLLPLGVIEKHGPSAPLGTDVLNVRHVTLLATRSEFALVFPGPTSGRSQRRGTSRARSRTAASSRCRCCRRPPRRWPATVAARSSW